MLHIAQRNKVYWLHAAANATTLGPMFICMLICVVILWRSSVTYASENLEIQKAFDSVVKHIKADKKYKDLDVIERKSDKFNIKIAQNSGKSFDIYSTLKKQKIPLNQEIMKQLFLSLIRSLQSFLIIKML